MTTRRGRRLGIFGGTFDPIHIAHLRVAEEVAETCDLDEVIFIPAGVPPHRRRPQATASQRLAMVKLAVAGNPRFSVNTMEIGRPGKSYTADTLAALRQQRPGATWFLLLGMDQVRDLAHWHEPERILALSTLVAFQRPGVPSSQACEVLHLPPGSCRLVQVSPLDISATRIRQLAGRRRSLRYLVPAAVAEYIRRHRLYRRAYSA